MRVQTRGGHPENQLRRTPGIWNRRKTGEKARIEVIEALESRLFLAAQLFTDVNAESLSSNPTSFTKLGDTTFFVADDGVHGQELFRSDGTTAGTAGLAHLRARGS